MVIAAISSEQGHGVVADPLMPSELDVADHVPLETEEARLRRVNSDLELLLAVEQQIAVAPDLSTLVCGILGRVQSLLRFELAAALILHDMGGQLFALQPNGTLSVREVEQRESQRLLGHARIPLRRTVDAGGSVADLLVEPHAGRVAETYSVPLSDGRSQIGIVQVVTSRPYADDEETVLRRLSLAAVQLGRAIVLQREREASERAERLLLVGRSVNTILHDMRTPLATVGACLNLMTAEDAQGVRSEHAARADRALEHLDRMTQEVLAFARGQREVLIRQVQLARFVDDVREMLAPELERFGTQLEINAEYAGAARFDEVKLKRVLSNLGRNAGQAGARKFVWRIARAPTQLLFECADNGPGIPTADQARLFESFASHASPGLGAGLGLAMVKKIIDAHCGRVYMNSDPGHGTVFRIELPL
jgi:signal transduction histidine kinase